MKLIFKILSLGFMLWFFSSCESGKSYINYKLSSAWEFRRTDTDTNWYFAQVPGTVHQDLLAQKLIPDPFIGFNDEKVQWVELSDWEYRTRFMVEDELASMENLEMIFEGLDTYAHVFLNGKQILNADNMFRSWVVNIKDIVRIGENELTVLLKSPVKEGMKKLVANGYSVPANGELTTDVDKRTSPFTRKAPFHYAWDWAPRLVTSGIWKPVSVRGWNKAKIDKFYFKQTEISEKIARFSLQLDIVATEQKALQAVVIINDEIVTSKTIEVVTGLNLIPIEVDINQPKLWWPNGLGEQYLYSVSINLMDGNRILDNKNHQLGIRTIQLLQEQDSVGESFYFKVNNIPVFMKGADYIPKDQLIPKVTEAEYERLITTAVDANMNMFRICGCTIYEQDVFYNLCDKYGILVWQDFMFACNMIPSQEAHLQNIQKEAEENVIRLRNHPSLALWCGNNENYVGWNYWNWKQRYGFSSSDSVVLWKTYEKVFFNMLPEAVGSLDPDRAYWPSSPKNSFKDPVNRAAGDQHDWGVWFEQLPYESYAQTFGRFVSEYGMQAYPSVKTLKTFASDNEMDMNSDVMRHHQRCRDEWEEIPGADGNDIILNYINKYYKAPKDFSSMVYLSQMVQAEAYKSALTSHRRNMPQCMGSLYWQFNDCWPTISWASLDYYFNWKASLYKVRDSNKPIILSFAKSTEKNIDLYIISDKLNTIIGALEIRLIDFDGKELWKIQKNVEIKSLKSEVIFQDLFKYLPEFDSKKTHLVARLFIKEELVSEDFFYFHLVKELILPEPEIIKEVEKTNNGYKVRISSNKLAKNIYLSMPDKEGHFSDNFFDLINGVMKVIVINTNEEYISETDIKIVSIKDTYN